MTPSENLWGELPVDAEARTPAQILQEQASHLERMTRGVLEGRIRTRRYSGVLQTEFVLVAPALDGYTYTLLVATHDVQPYPVSVHDFVNDVVARCEDEERFTETLRGILSSEAVRKVVASLLSQSRVAG